MLLSHMPQGLIILTNRMGWDNWRLSAVVITAWSEQLKISTALNDSFPCHNAWLFIPKSLFSFTFLWPKWSHVHFVIWRHGMSYENLSKGPRFLTFLHPLPVSLLFQLHCRGGHFIHVTWRSHNGTKIKWTTITTKIYSDSKASCMC